MDRPDWTQWHKRLRGREGCSHSALNATTKAVIESVGALGFAVELGESERQHVVIAVNEQTGERFVVRGERVYETVVEVAQQVGIELDDG